MVGTQATIPEIEYPIEAIVYFLVMSNRENCRALLSRHLTQQVHDDTGTLRIECCGRLIGENNPRTIGQCSGNRNALRLAARELRRECVLSMPNLQVLQQFDSSLLCFRWWISSEIEHDCYIVQTTQERQQIVKLKNKTDFLKPQTPQIGTQPTLIVDNFAVKTHPARIRFDDATNDVQQRRFSRPAGTEQSNYLTRIDLDTDLAQRVHTGIAFAKMFGDGTRFNQRM